MLFLSCSFQSTTIEGMKELAEHILLTPCRGNRERGLLLQTLYGERSEARELAMERQESGQN